jgi:signal peptidase I
MKSLIIIFSLTAIAFMVLIPNLAYGQFTTADYPGITYTAEDIAQGKAPKPDTTTEIEILSGSMLPYYQIGEYVTMNYSFQFTNLKVGDVIVFDPNLQEVNKAMKEGLMASTFNTDYYIMHRITNIDTELGGLIQTKGDNNKGSIQGVEYGISQDQIIGIIADQYSHKNVDTTNSTNTDNSSTNSVVL